MKNSISIKFYLNTGKPKGDTFPIYVRIISDRLKSEVSTKFFSKETLWDDEAGRSKKDKKTNEELAELENKIYKIRSQLIYDGRTPSAKLIKDILTEREKINIYLNEYYETYVTTLNKNKEHSNDTLARYRLTKEYVEEFVKKVKGVSDILIKQVDYKFLSDFDNFLVTRQKKAGEGTLQRNSISKHHSRFRTLLIRAFKEGHLTKNPYNDFTLKYTKSNRTYLTEKELSELMSHSLGNNLSLKKVRDIFIFSVYTGLRFEDAQSLSIKQIKKDKDGQEYIEFIQEKTDDRAIIPLLSPAQEIVKKYENEEREITGKVLPKISNQKVNAYLKTIAELVGIDKNLTHHVARHTCATTVLLSNQVPIEAVSKWMGHSNMKTTQIYAKITNQYLSKIAKKLEEEL